MWMPLVERRKNWVALYYYSSSVCGSSEERFDWRLISDSPDCRSWRFSTGRSEALNSFQRFITSAWSRSIFCIASVWAKVGSASTCHSCAYRLLACPFTRDRVTSSEGGAKKAPEAPRTVDNFFCEFSKESLGALERSLN